MRIARLIALLGIAAAISLTTGVRASAAAGPESTPPKHPKFASSIAQLADAASALPLGAPMTDETVALAGDAVAALVEAGVLRLDDQGRVQVYIHVLSAELYILDELEVMGILVERWSDSGTIIQAWVPVKALPALAEQEFVLAVTPPNYGHLNVGSTQTEGDSLLGFDGCGPPLV